MVGESRRLNVIGWLAFVKDDKEPANRFLSAWSVYLASLSKYLWYVLYLNCQRAE